LWKPSRLEFAAPLKNPKSAHSAPWVLGNARRLLPVFPAAPFNDQLRRGLGKVSERQGCSAWREQPCETSARRVSPFRKRNPAIELARRRSDRLRVWQKAVDACALAQKISSDNIGFLASCTFSTAP